MKAVNLVGQQFGRWTVISREPNTKQGWSTWLCHCECGNKKTLVGTVLTQGKSRSCGCLHREMCIERSTKHGHATNGISPTYHSWASMLARCNNPNNTSYPDWGGRGIGVCERWSDFRNFLLDMGEKPPNTSIDRINNDGNYEPSNCRWATAIQQRRNRRQPKPKSTRKSRSPKSSSLRRQL